MQDVFTKGMNRWFALKGFQLGMPVEGIDQNFSVEDFQSRIKDFTQYSAALGAAIGGSVRLLSKVRPLGGLAVKAGKWGGRVGKVGNIANITSTVATLLIEVMDSKTTAAELYEAIKPYTSRSDLIGLKLSNARMPNRLREDPKDKTFWTTVVVPVIYADRLPPALILRWFDEFLRSSDSLRHVGLRAKFLGNRARIYPLLVYFDSQKLEEDGESLWPRILENDNKGGVRPRTLSHKASWVEFKAHLSAGVVNVPERRVLSEIFNEDDLQHVLEWGAEQ